MVLNIFPRGTRVPMVVPKFIEDSEPQAAINADNKSGSLTPRLGLKSLYTITKAGEHRSIFKLGSAWIAWPSVVDVVQAQISNGDKRFYFLGDTTPKQSNETLAISGDPSTYPAKTRPWGISPPSTILTVTLAGTPDTEYDAKTLSYYYTYVTAWGEESIPSEETAVLTVPGGQHVILSNFVNPNILHITHFRVYRLETGTSANAEYQLVGVRPGTLNTAPVIDVPLSAIASANTQFFDADHISNPVRVNPAELDVCVTEAFNAPPATLTNLNQFLNGILVGSSGNDVCFSEPMYAYAWPISYRQTLGETIVGVGVFQSTVVAITTAYPYILQGTDPARMSKERLEYQQGCVSKRGVVNTRVGVIYPSPDGLFLVDGVNVNNLTENIYTPEQWYALTPSNLIGFFFDNAYFGFFSGTDIGIIVTLEGTPKLFEFDLGVNIYGGFVDASTNTLCLLGKSGVTYYVYEWGGGDKLTTTWQTKTFSSHPTNYAALQIKGIFDVNGVTITPVFDGTDQTPFVVTNENFVWLPAGKLYRDLSFKISSKCQIDQIIVAHSPEELIN